MTMLLLARYAESIFWMARYIERAENLARLIDVNASFARDDLTGGHNWDAIVRLNADEEQFSERYPRATPRAVVYFYTLDAENPTSIISSIASARENARALRPLISTEMWTHINMLHNRLKDMPAGPDHTLDVAKYCEIVKLGCQAHAGITEGTFYRDQGWYFYQIGKFLERADQVTRLLDVKYHALLPRVDDVGSPQDISQWNALLRSAAGYHAFRRVHPRTMTPRIVAEFMIRNNQFPRSVRCCIGELANLVTQLIVSFRLSRGEDVAVLIDGARHELEEFSIDDIIDFGMHEYLDRVQRDVASISSAMASAYFHNDDGK